MNLSSWIELARRSRYCGKHSVRPTILFQESLNVAERQHLPWSFRHLRRHPSASPAQVSFERIGFDMLCISFFARDEPQASKRLLPLDRCPVDSAAQL
jgi:hypothetical protein